MRRYGSRFLGILVLALPALAAEPAVKAPPAGKVVYESWDAAYLDGTRAGYVHTIVREKDDGKQKLYTTISTLELLLKRYKDTIRTSMETGTVETADGKVTKVAMKQFLAKQQVLEMRGVVQGQQLHVQVLQGAMKVDKKIPWDDNVLGLYKEQQIFKDRKAKPGDKFSYPHFEPVINSVVTVNVEVKDYEELTINGKKGKYLLVIAKPAKIETLQLPATRFWLDKDLRAVRFQVQMEGLGNLVMVETTQKEALKPVVPAQLPDIGQMLALDKPIPNHLRQDSVVYRITLPKDNGDLKTAFASDDRQEVKNVIGKSFELHVKAVRAPKKMANPGKPAKEFLESNYFICWKDEEPWWAINPPSLVQKHAAKAVGMEKDPWKQARLIERWVNRNMKSVNFTEAMATADHVAKTLEGDCTEFAMLTAAMCRAVGVPSRTAMGLVYVDSRNGGPGSLAYHMWTEVWIDGQWLALDATLGAGYIGAGHLKITDHSWYKTESLKPLLPVTRVVMGKPTFKVIEVVPDK